MVKRVINELASNTIGSFKSTRLGGRVMGDVDTAVKGQYDNLREATDVSRNIRNRDRRVKAVNKKNDAIINNPNSTPSEIEAAQARKLRMEDQATSVAGRRDENSKAIADSISGMGGAIGNWAIAADAKGNGMGRAMTLGARWGAVGAGSMAVGAGVRALNGGTFTTNNQGQRDIAGIPFL